MLRLTFVSLFIIFFGCNYFTENAAKKPARVAILTKFEVTILNTSIVRKSECSMNTKSSPYPLFDVLLILARNITKVDANYTLSIERGGKRINYFSAYIDYCTSLTMLNHNLFLSFLLKLIAQNGNIPLGCPLIQNFEYRLKDVNLSNMYIPPYMPNMNWDGDLLMITESYQSIVYKMHGKIVNAL